MARLFLSLNSLEALTAQLCWIMPVLWIGQDGRMAGWPMAGAANLLPFVRTLCPPPKKAGGVALLTVVRFFFMGGHC